MTYVRHFCDFCRKEISHNNLGTIDIPIPPFNGRPDLDPSPESVPYAICPNCAKDMKKRCDDNTDILYVTIAKSDATTSAANESEAKA